MKICIVKSLSTDSVPVFVKRIYKDRLSNTKGEFININTSYSSFKNYIVLYLQLRIKFIMIC